MLYEESRDRSDDQLPQVMLQRSSTRSFIERTALPAYQGSSQNSALTMPPQETWAGQAIHSAVAVLCGMVAGWVAMLPEQRDAKSSQQNRDMLE